MATMTSAPLPAAGTLEDEDSGRQGAVQHLGRRVRSRRRRRGRRSRAGCRRTAGARARPAIPSASPTTSSGFSLRVRGAPSRSTPISIRPIRRERSCARSTGRRSATSRRISSSTSAPCPAGDGLIVLGDGVTQDPNVTNFTPLANGGRNQLKVQRRARWDAIKAFVQFGIRAPISPVSQDRAGRHRRARAVHRRPIASSATAGRSGPAAACASRRRRRAALIVNGQLIGELRKVGTFDPEAFNEVRQNAAPPLGADGFAPASLLSVFALPAAHSSTTARPNRSMTCCRT